MPHYSSPASLAASSTPHLPECIFVPQRSQKSSPRSLQPPVGSGNLQQSSGESQRASALRQTQSFDAWLKEEYPALVLAPKGCLSSCLASASSKVHPTGRQVFAQLSPSPRAVPKSSSSRLKPSASSPSPQHFQQLASAQIASETRRECSRTLTRPYRTHSQLHSSSQVQDFVPLPQNSALSSSQALEGFPSDFWPKKLGIFLI